LDTSKLQLTFTARPSIRICRTRDWRRQWHPIRWHRRGWPFGRLPLPERRRCAIGTASGKKAFTGGDQGFQSLLLEKSEIVNHNTKKLTFKLPEPDMESGLPVACAYA
jgi:hypothetical protein